MKLNWLEGRLDDFGTVDHSFLDLRHFSYSFLDCMKAKDFLCSHLNLGTLFCQKGANRIILNEMGISPLTVEQ